MLSFVWGLVRFLLFWIIPPAVVVGTSYFLPWVNYQLATKITAEIFRGNIDRVSEPDFAYALAGILGFVALGLLISFLMLNIAPVLFTLWRAKRRVRAALGKEKDRIEMRRSFATGFNKLSQTLEHNRLIGHAWVEFEETLFDTGRDDVIGNTVRPQVFFNANVARERSAGLKMMNSVPGYFVGIGLLLTFIGLVFALYKAGAAANAGDSKIMADEMAGLLKIATFKFSTSISGLLASIVLSIFFRWFFILLEGAFDRFNAALEQGLRYHAPQSISMEINRTMQDQLAQLKDITQGDFFARMGSEIAPHLNGAITEAMAPITEQIGGAVGYLTTNSQDGVQKMLQSFTDSLQHSAGTEMRELAATIKQLQMSMVETQGDLRGSGDHFASKLAEAADNLNRLVASAGQSFEASSTQSRDALAAVVDSLRLTMEKANADIDSALGQAAGGASARLEAAMGTVMEKLERQIGQVGENLGAMQRVMGEQGDHARKQIDASVSHSAEIQKTALTDLQQVVQGVSSQLRAAVEEAVSSIGVRFSELSASMRAIEGALSGQKTALETTSAEARNTALAFGESANSVRAATAPLVSVGDRLSGATEKLAASMQTTLESLRTAKEGITVLSAELGKVNDKTSAFWNSFLAKFEEVDTALGKAVVTLSHSTQDQQERLKGHVRDVDSGLAEAIGRLSPLLTSLSESADAIADSMQAAKSLQPAQ